MNKTDKPYKAVAADGYRIIRTFFEMMAQSNKRYELTPDFASGLDAAKCRAYKHLGTSVNTVCPHIRSMLMKAGCKNRLAPVINAAKEM